MSVYLSHLRYSILAWEELLTLSTLVGGVLRFENATEKGAFRLLALGRRTRDTIRESEHQRQLKPNEENLSSWMGLRVMQILRRGSSQLADKT